MKACLNGIGEEQEKRQGSLPEGGPRRVPRSFSRGICNLTLFIV